MYPASAGIALTGTTNSVALVQRAGAGKVSFVFSSTIMNSLSGNVRACKLARCTSSGERTEVKLEYEKKGVPQLKAIANETAA